MQNNDLTLKVGFDIDKFTSELKKTNTALNSWATGVTKIFGGIAVASILKDVGREMIDVTAQFQKFEAILTNTLGSNSAAQQAMKEIKKFSIETPYEVNEITAAYVRWANMGLTPTIDKMRKVGDVAASLGAGFEQTAEAFKDLMVGQTKRLEEVGIAAEAIRGTNLLKLSFKGVTIEIEKNAEGVQKALDVYSQLNGVLGTSDAISQTLGGKISNLSDAWTNFLNTIGKGTGGIIGSVVSKLTDELNRTGMAIELINKYIEVFSTGKLSAPIEELNRQVAIFNRDADKMTMQEYSDSFQNMQKAAKEAGKSVTVLTGIVDGHAHRMATVKEETVHFATAEEQAAKAAQELADKLKNQAEAAAYAVEKHNQLRANLNTKSIISPEHTGLAPKVSYMGSPDAAISGVMNPDTLLKATKAWTDHADVLNENANNFANLANTVVQFSESFGQSIGAVLSGTQTAAQAFAHMSASVVQSIGNMIMAKMINKALDDKTTDFNFFAKLALIGVAVGTASALLNKIGARSSGGGGGIGGGSTRSTGGGNNRFEGLGQPIYLNLSMAKVNATTLQAVLDNQSRVNGRVRYTS